MPNSSSSAIMTAENIHKVFNVGAQDVEVLKGISTEVREGDFFVIFGPSGSGKSTLLHTLLGLEIPTQGQIKIMGEDCYAMTEDEAADFRKTRIGMVYQQPYWIKSLSVLENVSFPLYLMGQLPKEAAEKAEELLEMVGMADWRDYSPVELSAGQQQRVSLARALINNPALIVADEPTGNLDTKSGEELMQLLAKLNESGKTIVMVTHDLEYMKYANRMIRIVDGLLDGEYTQEDRETILKEIMQGKRGSGADHEFEVQNNGQGKNDPDNKSKKDKIDQETQRKNSQLKLESKPKKPQSKKEQVQITVEDL